MQLPERYIEILLGYDHRLLPLLLRSKVHLRPHRGLFFDSSEFLY